MLFDLSRTAETRTRVQNWKQLPLYEVLGKLSYHLDRNHQEDILQIMQERFKSCRMLLPAFNKSQLFRRSRRNRQPLARPGFRPFNKLT